MRTSKIKDVTPCVDKNVRNWGDHRPDGRQRLTWLRDRWVQVAIEWGNETDRWGTMYGLRFYINGRYTGFTDATASVWRKEGAIGLVPVPIGDEVRIGGRPGGQTIGLNGVIDELRISGKRRYPFTGEGYSGTHHAFPDRWDCSRRDAALRRTLAACQPEMGDVSAESA